MTKRILLVDDEQDILDLLQYNLKAEGYDTLTATNGVSALELAQTSPDGAGPDLIILDVMLPGKDGWEVMRQLRQNPNTKHIPVIFLTAKGAEIDEVVGLELGAEDYIVKPISIRKLLARVKTVLRKSTSKEPEADSLLRFGEVEINPLHYTVKVKTKAVAFTKKEFEVLVYLAKRPGRVITRDNLLTDVWGDDVVVIDRTIDVHIRKIREKLGEKNMHLIETIKGVGYRFKAKE
ncbi:MAG: response regulator transcription factor [candidate division KSB1 bacterium]|nr:response regulator transcription factor [candidate division KSB1 bacterium]